MRTHRYQAGATVGLAILLMMGAGCRKNAAWLDDLDRGLPIMQRAQARLSAGDIDGAIELFTQSLEENPGSSRAHLDLALLLHDQKKDYVGAIYHYRRYLALRPDTEKQQLIEDRIRLAKQALVGSVSVAGEDSAREIADLKKENTVLNAEVRRLTQQVEQLMGQAEAQSGEIARLKESDKVKPVPTPPPAEPRKEAVVVTSKPAAAPSRSAPRTYRVQPGESLIVIAKKVYGDGQDWVKIYEANRAQLGNSNRLLVGQLLEIP